MANQPNDGSLQVEGLNDLLKKFDHLSDEAKKVGFKAIEEGAMEIIAQAKENLKENGSIATGMLRASGKVQKVNELTIDAGFFDESNKSRGYAFYVENGRDKKKKMPPVDEIEAWLKKKTATRPGIKNAFASAAVFAKKKVSSWRRSLAWAIAKSIAENGTEPRPFLAPAIQQSMSKVNGKINEILKELTK